MLSRCSTNLFQELLASPIIVKSRTTSTTHIIQQMPMGSTSMLYNQNLCDSFLSDLVINRRERKSGYNHHLSRTTVQYRQSFPLPCLKSRPPIWSSRTREVEYRFIHKPFAIRDYNTVSKFPSFPERISMNVSFNIRPIYHPNSEPLTRNQTRQHNSFHSDDVSIVLFYIS